MYRVTLDADVQVQVIILNKLKDIHDFPESHYTV